jgi:DNA-binding CsgD family transcriptional regulator
MLSNLSMAPDIGDAFLRAAEAAHEIGSPQQFFMWLRLHLYRFVPHDLALTWAGGGADGLGRRAQVLNCVSLPDGVETELADPGVRFWHVLAECWRREGEHATVLSLKDRPLSSLAPASRLSEAGFDHIVVHGVCGPGANSEELVVGFLRRGPADPAQDEASSQRLELWMPYLHFALIRSDAGASRRTGGRGAEAPASKPLTDRELQVLSAVREAKANAQIAAMLGISPLTVKNHLRSIQRKLGARNRVHAVAEAMAMRLIS